MTCDLCIDLRSVGVQFGSILLFRCQGLRSLPGFSFSRQVSRSKSPVRRVRVCLCPRLCPDVFTDTTYAHVVVSPQFLLGSDKKSRLSTETSSTLDAPEEVVCVCFTTVRFEGHKRLSGFLFCWSQTMVEVLRKVFQYFTSFGDRRNLTWMSDFKFYKLLRHAKLVVRASLVDNLSRVVGCHNGHMSTGCALDRDGC